MQNMRTYDLDLETLLSLLRDVHQTGNLSAQLPAGFLGQKVPCWVRIDLVDGGIMRYQIEDKERNLLVAGNNDKKLLDVLYKLGALHWQLDTHDFNMQPPGTNESSFKNNVSPPDTNRLLFGNNTQSIGNNAINTPNTTSFEQRTDVSFSQLQANGNMHTTPPSSAERRTGPLPPIPPPRIWNTPSMPARSFSDIPRTTTQIDPKMLYTLSRRLRRVLALVDGTRSAEKIAALLVSTPKEAWIVLALLQELEAMRIITWEKGP